MDKGGYEVFLRSVFETIKTRLAHGVNQRKSLAHVQVFSCLTVRRQLLEGMLGANLIGFQRLLHFAMPFPALVTK
ncbi:hypothetical protein C8A03DRAFT_37856 [Achaetomium macrosporum]|uniref:Uncharacterized protein n=1 Tax=Achaetomium macrosporum TaxID=79813 RepID=A0AAN7C3L1_9PEZI|nr:hypothetical protein C8A03DRAFT_37856 [Achaetomium macrosporum]